MQELVVPKSIPITFAINSVSDLIICSRFFQLWLCQLWTYNRKMLMFNCLTCINVGINGEKGWDIGGTMSHFRQEMSHHDVTLGVTSGVV